MCWYLSDSVWQMILQSEESQKTKAEHLCEYLCLQLQLPDVLGMVSFSVEQSWGYGI